MAQTRPVPPGLARQMAHGLALADIGRSGLRSLLSASGNLGELQNRLGSYRMTAEMEGARTAALDARIAALQAAMVTPGLPPSQRDALRAQRDAAVAERGAVPRYEASYRTATTQVEALIPSGFLGVRPIFLMVRARGHARWGGEDGLTVFSEGVSVSPVLVTSNRWMLSPGVSLDRTDVGIGAFDGRSGTTAMGPRLDLGWILREGWSTTLQVSHEWARSATTIVRPDGGSGTEVRTQGVSQTTAAKVELKGHFALPIRGTEALVLHPRAGAFLLSTRTPATTNNLGETGTGPFGERETVAALRAGASADANLGAWSPSLYLGWEGELTHRLSTLVHDPQAFLGTAEVSWSWHRTRRALIDYSLLRGFRGLRRIQEITLVLILDG